MSEAAVGPRAHPPKVFTIAPHLPFADQLARGILDRQGDDPLALSRTRIFVPHNRGARALREAFLRQGGGEALILPRISPIEDIDEGELVLHDAAGDALSLPPAITPTRRQLLLMPLVVNFLEISGLGGGHTMAIAPPLAAEFARLIDTFHTEGITLKALEEAGADLPGHWQLTLNFLRLAFENWPKILAEEGLIDPADRRNRLLDAQSQHWRDAPPDFEVIAAGSTGSIPATARLLSVIARLPKGAVVLPGLDSAMDEKSWQALSQSHPQFGLKTLLDEMRVDRREVEDWPLSGATDKEGAARTALISDVMRPAATTRAWQGAKVDEAALAGLTRLDLEDVAEEAEVIALILREALETPGRTGTLITPDRGLARRVVAALKRWDIAVNDSAGQPLSLTPLGSFLTLVIDLALTDWTPARLLSLLKHPLTALGMAPADCRRQARALELAFLRGPRPAAGTQGLMDLIDEKTRHLRPLIKALEEALAPLTALPAEAGLGEIVAAHIQVAERLAASDEEEGAARLWRGEEGEAATLLLEELLEAADAEPFEKALYPALMRQFFAGVPVRPRYGLHPRLFIWSPMEARLQSADVTILGGLNEGGWPQEAMANAWLSRPMQRELGLPTPERQIGQSAHDFVSCAAGGQVYLTRATKVDGVPTVPSRWLLRLKAVTRDAALSVDDWRHWRQALTATPRGELPGPPAPRPPVEARPDNMSVTDVERWMRDPYALYAKKILKLYPLEPIDAEVGPAERGTLIHGVFEQFLEETRASRDWQEGRLIALAEEALRQAKARPLLRVLWRPRFRHVAAWFVAKLREDAAQGRLPVLTEVKSDYKMMVDGLPFTLIAKADRIDKAAEGVVIVDYKTGNVPGAKQIKAGFAPQLPLEALMAENGAFDEVGRVVAGLEFWAIKGTKEPAKITPVKDLADRIAQADDGLMTMIRRFRDEATPYLSQPRPEEAKGDDYDHLARVKEWRDGGGS